MKFFSRYNPPPSLASPCGGKSMTHQEFAAECDINHILTRVGLGQVELRAPAPVYVDLTDVPTDYAQMMDKVLDAQQRFAQLPSRVRERFANDPARLLHFLSDEKNYDEALKLGLVNERKAAPSPLSDGSEPPKSDVVNS